MKKLLLTLIVIVIGNLVIAAQTKNKKSSTSRAPQASQFKREKFDPKRIPASDLKIALAKAQKENKNVVLDLGGEWCVWCIKMDNFIEANKNLKSFRNKNFVWVKVNVSEENENKQFLSAYPAASGYPHLYVLDKNGTLLKSKDTAELEEPHIPIVVPANVVDKEKYMAEEAKKRPSRSYVLQNFIDFLKEYAPAKKATK